MAARRQCMSRRLALIDDALAAARALARKGRTADALAQMKLLLRRPDLPVAAAADAHRVAGEVLLDRGSYGSARRHLRAARTLEPEHARTLYLLGLAQERDPQGSDRTAARCFAAASRRVPDNPTYRAALGRAAVRAGCPRRGVKELIAAATAAPQDEAVLAVAIEGLLEAGRIAAAYRITVQALFSCPGSGTIRRLRERVRFVQARRGQRRAGSTQDAGLPMDGGVRLLPFLRVVRSGPGGRMLLADVRRDVASTPRPHLTRRRSRTDR